MDGATTETDRGHRRGRWLLLFVGPILFATLVSRPAFADKRVALVIGNSSYRSVARLDNPRNDAELLADTLRSLGFALVGGGAQLDLDKPAFDRTVQAFGAQLAGADVGLFYYAGHGVQVRGENYLIPVEANPTKEADVDFQMLDTNLVLRQMEGAGTRLNIVILDACRNNPFGGRGLAVDRAREAENTRLRATTGGLAQMQAPEGTLISFATQPGSVAQDGAGGNSPYAKALARAMRRPGLDIFQTFNQVGLAVKRETGGLQLPWVSTSPIDGSFYFVTAPGDAVPAETQRAGAPIAAAVEQPAIAPASTALPPSTLPSPTLDQSGKTAPPTTAATAALSTPSPGASTPEVRRFDGTWVVSWVCESTPSGLPEVKGRFIGKATNGVLRGEVGMEGNPGWSRWNGTIEPDGSITIKAEGLSGDTKTDPFHRAPGTKMSYTMIGTLEGTSGVGTRADRDCNIRLTKQSVAALSPTRAVPPEPQLSSAPSVPQADGLFTEQDMQRVRAIAAEHSLTVMPVFKIERPDSKLPVGLRKFVGVWASEMGFGSGRGRHAMLIVTSVEAPARAAGYYVWGMPTEQQIRQSPAGVDPFEGKATGDQLTFQEGARYSATATLTGSGNLSLVQKKNDGELSYVTLKPVWRLLEAEQSAKR
jgi:uncharacterized caspase-like protein